MAITDQVPAPRPGGGLAIASLLTGIAAVFACGIGIIAGPIAVLLGVLAGRKGGFGARAFAGIITGALGFLIWAGALVWLLVYAADDDDRTITWGDEPVVVSTAVGEGPSEDTAAATASPGTPGDLVLTEAGIADAGFPTAYAAFLETYGVSASFDGMYAGEPIDTPCFTMDGEAWWVTQGDPSLCQPSSELWWETESGTDEIKLFGSGGRGAMIAFVPLETEKLLSLYSSTELTVVSADARDTMLPGYGCAEIVETPTTLAGLPAVSLDCTLDGYASYRVYAVMLPAPRILEDGTSISGFFIEAFNELEWVYPSEDVYARLEGTLQWK